MQSLRPDDGQVHFRVFLDKSRFCYINGHHKQYVQVDTQVGEGFMFFLDTHLGKALIFRDSHFADLSAYKLI